MARRKNQTEAAKAAENPDVVGLKAEVVEQPITETLEHNYMPYAMSVIVSRAIPEIDGFKPSTASCSIPCIKWACSPAPAPRAPTSWARPCA